MRSAASFVASAVILSSFVSAHTVISPALGVKGNAGRNDAKRPAFRNECGGVSPNLLDASTKVPVRADGSFDVTVTNFNGGRDGSLHVDMQFDPSGTGKGPFIKGNTPKNGDLDPKNTQSIQVTAQLPPGTKCTGGNDKKSCLVTFTAAGGFGNCVAVTQAGGQKREVVQFGTRAARFYREVDARGVAEAEADLFADDLDKRDAVDDAETDLFADDLNKRDAVSDAEASLLNDDLTKRDAVGDAEASLFEDDLTKRDAVDDAEADLFADDLTRRDAVADAEASLFEDDLTKRDSVSDAEASLFEDDLTKRDIVTNAEASLFEDNIGKRDAVEDAEADFFADDLDKRDAVDDAEAQLFSDDLNRRDVSFGDDSTLLDESDPDVQAFLSDDSDLRRRDAAEDAFFADDLD